VVRTLLLSLVGRMTSPIAREITSSLVERTWPHVRLFEQYRETHGHSALWYRDVRLDGLAGALRTVFWVTRAACQGRSGCRGTLGGPTHPVAQA
jgi:hypothetical protein